jgi:hypothetical protein
VFSLRSDKFEAKRSEKEVKKSACCFRLNMRKQSETDPVSLRFASKRKKFLSETGGPYEHRLEQKKLKPEKFRNPAHTRSYRNSVKQGCGSGLI